MISLLGCDFEFDSKIGEMDKRKIARAFGPPWQRTV